MDYIGLEMAFVNEFGKRERARRDRDRAAARSIEHTVPRLKKISIFSFFFLKKDREFV